MTLRHTPPPSEARRRHEAALRLRAIEQWAKYALDGLTTPGQALEAITGLAAATRQFIDTEDS